MKSQGLDSARSWVIAVSCSVIFLLAILPLRLGGQMFVAFFDRYNTDRKAASFSFALAYMMRSLSGPFAGYFGDKFGLQEITFVGCLLCALGNVLCYFAEDIVAIDICLGLLYGIGCGWATSLLPEIINQHFDKYRAVANGITCGGCGLGAFIFPPIFEVVMKSYGLSGSFLILGGFLLNGIPAAMLLHKPKLTSQVNDTDNRGKNFETNNEKNNGTTESNGSNKLFVLSYNRNSQNIVNTNQTENGSFKYSEKYISYDELKDSSKEIINQTPDNFIIIETKTSDILKSPMSTEQTSEKNSEHCDELNGKWKPITLDCHELNRETDGQSANNHKIDDIIQKNPIETSSKKESMCDSLSVLWSPLFLILTLIQSSHFYVVYMWWTIIVDVVRDKHVEEDKEVYFVVAMALFDTLGRFVLGIITDKGCMSRSNFCVFCFTIMGLACVLMPWVSGFYTTMFVICLCGLMIGGNTTGLPGIINKFIDKDKRTMAMSSRIVLYAPMSFTMSPVIGYFRGNLGSYDGVFYVLTAISMLCGVILIILSRIFKNKNEDEND